MEDRTQPCANCRCLAIRVPHLLRKLWRGLGALWLVLVVCSTCWGASAVCRVAARSNQAMPSGQSMVDLGSGTLAIDNGHSAVVYSCGHVVKDTDWSTVVCTFDDGRKFQGVVIAYDEQHDLSAIAIQSPKDIKPYPVGDYQGGEITIGGWGGPQEPLRFLSGNRMQPYAGEGVFSVVGPSARQGDSGGPVINNGHLIGVLWGTLDSEVFIHTGPVFQAFHQSILAERSKGGEIRQTQCYGGSCAGGGCSGGGITWGPPRATRPMQPIPQPTPQPAPAPAPQPVVQQPAFDWTEYDKRQAKLLKAIAANKCQCKPCDCKPTDLTPVIEKLDVLIAASSKTPPAPTPVPQPTHEQHVVIVADHNGDYWQRLATTIATTQKTYAGIQETTLPPFAIGPHPVAIVYRDSVPVRKVTGLYEVENLLARLARNEPI